MTIQKAPSEGGFLAYSDLVEGKRQMLHGNGSKKFTLSIYKIHYEQFRQQPEITQMLLALEKGFENSVSTFYLVAVARDM